MAAVTAFASTAAPIGSSLSEGYRLLSGNSTGHALTASVIVAALGALAATTPLRRPLAVAGLLIAALPGHAIGPEPVWRSSTLTLLHVLAAIGWAAGLIWLIGATRADDPNETSRAVRRFSPWAMACVVVLATTGALLRVTRTGWSHLLSSGYGAAGLIKIALLLMAVAMAARNRYALMPRLTADPSMQPTLRRSIQVEVVVLSLALLAGTVLGQISPPQSAAAAGPFLQRAAFGDGTVELLIDPARVGQNDVHVSALRSDGTLNNDVKDLAAEMTLPAQQIGPLAPTGSVFGGHVIAAANLTVAGRWTVRITGHVGTFDEPVATFEVEIRR